MREFLLVLKFYFYILIWDVMIFWFILWMCFIFFLSLLGILFEFVIEIECGGGYSGGWLGGVWMVLVNIFFYFFKWMREWFDNIEVIVFC